MAKSKTGNTYTKIDKQILKRDPKATTQVAIVSKKGPTERYDLISGTKVTPSDKGRAANTLTTSSKAVQKKQATIDKKRASGALKTPKSERAKINTKARNSVRKEQKYASDAQTARRWFGE